MGTDFKLVAAGFVDVRRAQNVKAFHACWQRYGTFDNCACAFGCANNLGCSLVNQFVVEGLEADADFLF